MSVYKTDIIQEYINAPDVKFEKRLLLLSFAHSHPKFSNITASASESGNGIINAWVKAKPARIKKATNKIDKMTLDFFNPTPRIATNVNKKGTIPR